MESDSSWPDAPERSPARGSSVAGVPVTPAPADGPLDPSWGRDPRKVLSEIDAMDRELRPHSADEVPPPPPPSASVYLEDGPGPEALLSPYLQERLRLAAASASALGAGLRSMDDPRWLELQSAAAQLETELGNATREIEFLRNRREMPDGEPPAATPIGASTTNAETAPQAFAPAPYVEYTVERYNRTIDAVKARRRSVVAWSLVLAAAISGCLLTLTVYAREATPPVWLAALPAIWLIPVPFFIISFLATHRVLRRNHLNLARGA